MNLSDKVYFAELIAASILSVVVWRKFVLADKFIAILMPLTLLDELFARFSTYRWRTNLPVYHVYSPLELLLTCLYFNYSIKAFRKRKAGIIVGLTGVVLSLANTLFIQKITSINSYFLLFEGTVIIVMSLLAFHQILMDEERMPYRFANFWITICFILYWSSTFTGWGIYDILDPNEFVLNPIFEKVLEASNYVFYLGISLVFLGYKKLIPSGE